jgi:hypothetical protein
MSAMKSQKKAKSPSRERLLQAIGLMTTAKPTMLMRPNDPVGMAKEIVEEMEYLREEVARLAISNTLSGYDMLKDRQKVLKNLRGEELVWCECGSEITPYCRYLDHGVIKGHICLTCNKVVEEGPSEIFEVVREQRDQLREKLIRAEEETKFFIEMYRQAAQYAMGKSSESRILLEKVVL